jgi:hypothetical protein
VVCQEVIPVVEIRGIWLQNLANDRIPAPTILHQQFPCLLRHKFLTGVFLGVRQTRSGLFRPKPYCTPKVSVGSPSRDTIPLSVYQICATLTLLTSNVWFSWMLLTAKPIFNLDLLLVFNSYLGKLQQFNVHLYNVMCKELNIFRCKDQDLDRAGIELL